MRPIHMNRTGGLARGLRVAAVMVGSSLPFAACDAFDNLLNVDAPGLLAEEQAESAASAQLLMNGAVGDFECAFGSFVAVGGVIGEELTDATQTASRWVYDRRVINPSDGTYASGGCTSLGLYTPLSTARYALESLILRLDGWTDEEVSPSDPQLRSRMIATAAAYSGYTHLLLGEVFATGVLLDENLEPGGEVDRGALLERAVARFDRAIQLAGALDESDLANMARVGKARALLNLGDVAEAGAEAAQVPDGFAFDLTASTTAGRRENRVYRQNNTSKVLSVAPESRGLVHMGQPDPRTDIVDTGETASDGTRIFVQSKYASLEAPLQLATWREARLIEAEAELAANNPGNAVNILNALHANAGLPADYAETDAALVRAHLIEERRHELFLEGHHLGDVIRYDLTLSPAEGEVYQTEGGFQKGGQYGPDGAELLLPLPDVERLNNPNIGG